MNRPFTVRTKSTLARFSRYKLKKEINSQRHQFISIDACRRNLKNMKSFYSPYWRWKLFQKKHPSGSKRKSFSSRLSRRAIRGIMSGINRF